MQVSSQADGEAHAGSRRRLPGRSNKNALIHEGGSTVSQTTFAQLRLLSRTTAAWLRGSARRGNLAAMARSGIPITALASLPSGLRIRRA